MADLKSNEQKKVIVTGGAGFIGSHVVEWFLREGYLVAVIDNFSTGVITNFSDPSAESLIIKELSVTSQEAKEFIKNFQPEIFVHLAAQASVRKSVEDPIFDAEQNIIGLINILEGLKKVSLSHLIFSSTGGAIYGEQEAFPADETHRINPECPYGLSKRCSEMYLNYYCPELKKSNNSLLITALRFGNVYGPRQNPQGEAGVVAIFSKKAINGETLLINGDGSQTRDFIYVGDIVSAIKKVVSSDLIGARSDFDVFNLGTGIETNINYIASTLASVAREKNLNVDPQIVYGPRAPGEQARSLLNAHKFTEAYNWVPEIDIDTGLNLTIDSFKNS